MDQFNSLKNKIIIVTGSSRGIGKKISQGFLKNGAKVIGVSKKFHIKKIIKNKNYKHYYCDLSDKKEILKVLDNIKKENKKIDILINNAGITKESAKSLEDNIKDFSQTINVNLIAAYLFSIMAVLKMKKNKSGGTIINISSIGGELGFPNNPSYISSKSGLIGLTRSFARDYGKFKINCNAVLPGYFKTEMNKKTLSNKKKRKQREDLTMLGRWGELNELIGTILFLSTDSAKYITGQKIIIDGGIVAKGL